MKLNMSADIDMLSGRPLRAIVAFAVPLILGNLFQLFYTTADVMIVGKYAGVTSLAAVGACAPALLLITGLFIGAANGMSLVVSQQYGAGRVSAAKAAVVNGLYLLMAAVAAVTALSFATLDRLFALLNVAPELLDEARAYMRILLGGLPFTALYHYEAAVLRARGNSLVPLLCLIFTSTLNIFLDVLFVSVFSLAASGVAFATVLAQGVCVLLCWLFIKKRGGLLPLHAEEKRPDARMLMLHVKNGLPMAGFHSLLAVSFIVMQSALNALGVQEIAAYTAAVKMDSVVMLSMSGFGMALSTFTATNYGKKEFGRIKAGAWDTLKITMTVSALIAVTGHFCGATFMKAFVNAEETEVIALGARYIDFASLCYWILGVNFVVRFVLTGLGQSVVPLGVGILEIFIRVLGTRFLIMPLGYRGMIYINPLCWIVSTALVALFYFPLMNGAFRKAQTSAD